MLNFSNKPSDNHLISDEMPNSGQPNDSRFSNKPDASQNGAGLPTAPVEEVTVHAMPGKFLPSKPVKTASASGSGRKILTFTAVFLFLAVAILAGAYWYLNLPKVPAVENVNQPLANQNTNLNENSNSNTNQNINTNTNTNSNQNQNTNINANNNSNTNTNTNTNEPIVLPPVENPDIDKDLLTYEEEGTFGTDINSDDSDKDGYKDGTEIINLYNPLVPAQALADSGLVKKFINSVFPYSVLTPSAWLINAVSDDFGNIMILPDSESGEFFTIYTMSNTNNWNLDQARANLPNILGADTFMQNYSLAKQPAFRSIDQKKVLMVADNYIYIIVYEFSGSSAKNFDTTFQMLLNSFELRANE